MRRAMKVEMFIRPSALKGADLILPVSTLKNIFNPYFAQEQFSAPVGSAYAVILPEVVGESLIPPVSPYYVAIPPAPPPPPPPGWWDPNWQYRRTITISGYHPTDYQLKVVLPFYDPSIRFLEDATSGSLPYWVEGYTADSMTVWVKRYQENGEDNTIYVYYGNPNAGDASDGNATFIFFDDAEVGNFTDKWTINAGSHFSYSNDYARSGSRSIKMDATYNIREFATSIASPFDTNRAFDFYFRDDGDTDALWTIGVWTGDLSTAIEMGVDTKVSVNYYEIGGWGHDWFPTNVGRTVGWHKGLITWDGSTYKLYINGTYVGSFSETTQRTKLGIHHWYDRSYPRSCVSYFDDLRVRKYTEPEPTVSVGEEEQYGG
jgi:hypothetical protein